MAFDALQLEEIKTAFDDNVEFERFSPKGIEVIFELGTIKFTSGQQKYTVTISQHVKTGVGSQDDLKETFDDFDDALEWLLDNSSIVGDYIDYDITGE